MQLLTTILSLILFFIALGVLVSIHEAGHLIAAKSFNVYCPTYSIGFGPKIIKHKRKGGETEFTLSLLPLGGYVAIYQDGVELPDGVKISRKRSIEGIKRWQRIVVFIAGIVMNFILAFIIFLISASCFKNVSNTVYLNVGKINNETTFKETFKNEDGSELNDELITFINGNSALDIRSLCFTSKVNNEETKIENLSYYFIYTDNIEVSLKDGTISNDYALAFSSSLNYKNPDYSDNFILLKGEKYIVKENDDTVYYYEKDENNNTSIKYFKEGTTLNIPTFNEGSLEIPNLNDIESIKFNLTFKTNKENDDTSLITLINMKINDSKLDKLGFGVKIDYEYLGWKSFKVAGKNWSESTKLIAQAIGNLFTNKNDAWSNVGGPVAIFTQTTTILSNYPFYVYLNTWGTISVNLALFNLLPFPGLDGWQILVEIVEGCVNLFYKPINKKKEKNKDNENNNDNKNLVVSELKDDQVTIDKDTKVIVGKTDEIEEKLDYDTEWHIPSKVKNIVSYIGLGLLFLFMFIIIIKDVVGLF